MLMVLASSRGLGKGRHKMQEKKYGRLTIGERRTIEQGLSVGDSFGKIAASLRRSKSTISREILRNSSYHQTGSYGAPFNNCINRNLCKMQALCFNDECTKDYCTGCMYCAKLCKEYEREDCIFLDAPPYVCNGCKRRHKCTLEKAIYKPGVAQHSADTVLKDTRSGIDLSKDELARISKIVEPLILQGQSPWHICETNKDALMISNKTLYNYISAGLFGISDINLARKVKMKPRKSKPLIKVDSGCRIGRTYIDFLEHMTEYPDTPVVEMDSVIGVKGSDEKCLLTIHFPASELMLAFIRDNNTAKSVTEAFETIKVALGYNRFCELFPLILTDNGSEFSDPTAIETDDEFWLYWTSIFYCDPRCAYQKPHIENNHTLLRRYCPKGKSMNALNQDDIDLMLCHLNSYKRKTLGGQSPIEVFAKAFGNKMLKLLNIYLIDPNDVVLSSSIFKK
jgi:IS30 family transposase